MTDWTLDQARRGRKTWESERASGRASADEWRSRTFIFQTATETNNASLKFDKTARKLTGGKCQENGTTSGKGGGLKQGRWEEEKSKKREGGSDTREGGRGKSGGGRGGARTKGLAGERVMKWWMKKDEKQKRKAGKEEKVNEGTEGPEDGED